MNDKEINQENKQLQIQKEVIEMYNEGRYAEILEYIKTSHQKERLNPKTYAYIFLAYVNVVGWENKEEGISPLVKIDDLVKINEKFKTENGCVWAADDRGILKDTYKIERPLREKGSGRGILGVKLTGLNKVDKGTKQIRSDIKKVVSAQRCAILDVSGKSGKPIEVDHKNGRYNDPRVMNTETQELSDFQPLSKAANDAKRQHCKECIRDGKRYDAKRLGYKEGWISGSSDTTICTGCYWYDVKEFNKTISENFVAPEDNSK